MPGQSRNENSNLDDNDVWLYINGFSNVTTSEQLRLYVASKTGCENVVCQSLLKRGVDPRSRRELSFKLKIPQSALNTVSCKSFWPDYVRVRAFTSDKDFSRQRQERNRSLQMIR